MTITQLVTQAQEAGMLQQIPSRKNMGIAGGERRALRSGEGCP